MFFKGRGLLFSFLFVLGMFVVICLSGFFGLLVGVTVGVPLLYLPHLWIASAVIGAVAFPRLIRWALPTKTNSGN